MTGVCKICGQSFSNSNNNETICPKCRYEENWNKLYTIDIASYPIKGEIFTSSTRTGITSELSPKTLTIMAQKIVLENGGIQLVIDNDTIKNINTIEVNGIRFERVKE